MAPTTACERMRKYRDKLKASKELWEQHLVKDKMRAKKKRDALKKSTAWVEENREESKKRMRLMRERKKAEQSKTDLSSPLGSYKSRQSLGKAVKRLKQVLPESPRKKQAVIQKVVSDVLGPGNAICQLPLLTPKIRPSIDLLANDVKTTVRDFFCTDSISYQTPGVKDYITIKNSEGKKSKVQKRFLIMNVSEAYQEFKKSYPSLNVGKSVFYSLRPPHVLLLKDTPHNVCVCKTHFNFIHLLEAIANTCNNVPKGHNELLTKLCCDTLQESCMYGECENCSSTVGVLIDSDVDLQQTIKWKQWTAHDKQWIVQETSGSLGQAIHALSEKLVAFKKHWFIKKKQSDHFQHAKENLLPTEAVLQMDFAENYSIISQDEIQSAHWCHGQVTIFTACASFPDKTVKCFAVISDNRDHNKYAVWTFMKEVLSAIKKMKPELKHIKIFTDNCAGQFKNKYSLSNLCFFEKDFGLTADWNFFASSHGKGAVDGVGAVVKRTAWMGVKARKVIINEAQDFYNYVSKEVENVECMYVESNEIQQNIPSLDKRWELVTAIPKIQECHHFIPSSDDNLMIAKTASSVTKMVPVFETVPMKCRKPSFYKRVYSSSSESEEEYEEDNDDEVLENEQTGAEDKYLPDSTAVKTDCEIKTGAFVLIQINPLDNSRSLRRNTSSRPSSRYIGICQSDLDDEGEVKVTFLKGVPGKQFEGRLFKLNDNDTAYVKADDILYSLPYPQIQNKGDRLFYLFDRKIDVTERLLT